MTTNSIVEIIQHYQRSIDGSQDNEARLLHCINKLYKLPIKVEHLQETGVGKTVNSLRKFNGEIGVAAKTLVTKWKAMVAAEEEPMDTTSQTNDSETHDNNNDDDDVNHGEATPHEHEDDENHNRHNTSPQEQNKHDKDKEKHKERSSSSIGHKESRHSSSHHHGDKSSKNSHDKHKSSSKDKESNHKSSSSSSGKDKEREKEKTEHKSSRDKHKDKDNQDHKDRHREHSEKRKEEKHKTTEKDIKLESSSSSSSQHKTSSSTSSKSKHDDKHGSSSSKDKDKERSDKHKSSSKDKERTKEVKSSSSSSSKDKSEHKSASASTSKSSTKDSADSLERKRRHNSDSESNDFKSPQPKVAKVSHKSSSSSSSSKHESKPETTPPQEGADDEVVDDSFDSSMGANFNDILGMLDVPVKKGKKSLKSPSLTPGGGSSSSKKESTPSRPSTSSSSNSTPTKVNGVRTPFSASSSYSTPSTSKSVTMKPDLLAPTAKLEPLDPSIALELPTISTNYKPMPLNQTVMDCVFNTASSSYSRPARTLTDAEAITHGISSKTMRTKIYSGVRTGQTFQVSSLFDMCIRILQKNIDALEYTGGVPFEVLKPVLDRCSPQQLYNFEEYNPYIMEDSDGLWQVHVQRNYRTKKREENESWREMFMRCEEEAEQRLSMLKHNIKASQKIATAPIRKTQLAFIDTMVKPPRNVQRKQEQYGTKSKLVATPAARVASLQSVTPNAAKTGDQRLRVAAPVREHVHTNPVVRNKKAPLMAKTLQFIKGRLKR